MMKLKKNMFFKTALVAAVVATSVALGMGSAAYAETGKTVSGDSASQNDSGSGEESVPGDDVVNKDINDIVVTDLSVDNNFRVKFKIARTNLRPYYVLETYKKNMAGNQYVSSAAYIAKQVNSFWTDIPDANEFSYDRLEATDARNTGLYRFVLCIAENENAYKQNSGCRRIEIGTVDYVCPTEKVAPPKNIKWDKGVVTWEDGDVEAKVYAYEINLYQGNRYVHGHNIPFGGYVENGETFKNLINFNKYITGDGKGYYVRIRSISRDVVNYTHSDYVNSLIYNADGVSEKVNEELNKYESAEVDQSVVDEIANIGQDKLQQSMQTNQETINSITIIENKFNNNPVIKNCENEVFENTEKINIVGAKLNASPGVQVSLNIAKASDNDLKKVEDHALSKEHMVAFNMNLEGENVPEDGSLKVPVRITLPIPTNVDVNRLKILHFSSVKETEPDILSGADLYIDTVNRTVSFTIKHFSLFAMYQDNNWIPPTPDHNIPSIPNAESNSEAIIVDSNGNTVVEPERWVPTTPDEIKRYAFLGKEPVVFANAEGNAYPVKVYNSIQGPKCFVSFEAVLADYNMARTYNIYPNNKPGYSMDSKARITIEIPELLRQKGRTFKMICVTEGGTPIVLNDLDKNPNTITFETDKYYAFALIYK